MFNIEDKHRNVIEEKIKQRKKIETILPQITEPQI